MICADFARLAEETARLEAAGADWLHFDVMDGHFVPNLTHGVLPVRALRAHSSLPFDVHLMVEHPEVYIDEFAAAGADGLTIQLEATQAPHRCLRAIQETGARPGVAISPATPVDSLRHLMEEVGMVLVMSVDPGYAGQSFIQQALPKLATAREMIEASGREILLQADGGVNAQTAEAVLQHGADVLVMGSALFGHADGYEAAIREVREIEATGLLGRVP
jgi:ribulose-phosphate 3-epimerase